MDATSKRHTLRNPGALFATPSVRVERAPDGTLLVTSPRQLGQYPRCLGEFLVRWAREAPERHFLLERTSNGEWQGLTYGQALNKVRIIAGWLLSQDASADRPVAILSENSIEHGLLTLAAMHIGSAAMPISPAYSLQSRDFAKLKGIIARAPPAVIFVADCSRYAPALAAIEELHSATIVVGSGSDSLPKEAIRFDELKSDVPDWKIESAFAAVTPDTIAKILYTSGSTDEPKGVINTQRMLCCNQQAKAQGWPFLETSPPVIVDWLPWNHTFGGNHNFNLILRNGGTLYIDTGRPVPTLFAQSIRNLREVSPTIYFNVPRGYEMLVEALRSDEVLRRSFFRRLQVIFFAAASLPRHLWEALKDLSLAETGEQIALLSGWGSTETAPLATDCHFLCDSPAVIGLPVPGCDLKLLPNGTKLEVRVRGPLVTPGYWRRPDLTARSFDEAGFYVIGDAVRFLDESRPELGLVFDGRVAEDFKLVTGTWVNVGTLRLQALVTLSPLAQDIVVAGHDRDSIGFLIFPNLAACRARSTDLPPEAPIEAVLAHPDVRGFIENGLRQLRSGNPASSAHAACALLLVEPPSIDAGEITDKGYINQRAVLARRHAWVQAMYSGENAGVIRLQDP